MAKKLSAFFFPDPPRAFRGRRGTKIGLRAGHVLCAGTLVGAYLLDVDQASRDTWLWATLVSGSLLLLLDLSESAAFLFEVRGLVVIVKLVSLGLLPLFGETTKGFLLAFLLVGSVLSSHAPSSVRHRMLASRFQSSQTKG